MRDLAILGLFCSMVVLSVRYVHLCTMLWVWTALAAPGAYLYGVGVDFPFNKVAAAATAVAIIADRSKRRLLVDGFFILFTLFLIQGIISFVFALTDYQRTYDILERMLKIWALVVVMRIGCRDRLQIHSLVVILAFSLGVHGALEGMKYVASAGGHKVAPSTLIGDNNYLALSVLMSIPLIVYLFRYLGNALVRTVLAGFGCACFVGVVATASRGGLIGLAVLGVMLLVHSRRKALALVAILAVAAGLAVFAPSRWVDRMETIRTAENDDSFMNRVISWKMNTVLAIDRPFLGGGYSALEDGRVHRAYLPMFHILDFIPTDTPEAPLAAHSIYFSVLGDLGFTGLLLFLAMLAATFVNISKVRMMARGKPELVWAYDLASALRTCMIIFVVVGAALSAAYFEVLYIQITLISILRRSLEENAKAPSRAQAALAAPPPGRAISALPSGRWAR
jgi:probable O-glycosylation ligase (exosortase A-associated)